jgi:parvulin-like peptidyl-prolyl isomerase
MRADFASDPKRVIALLDGLLLRKSLAADAQRQGLAPSAAGPEDAGPDQRLAQAWIAQTEAAAGAEFDRRGEQFAARARELYALEPRRYAIPEEIVVSHIAFSIEKRGREAALQAALAARADVVAGKDFEALAAERSDASDARTTRGRLPAVTRATADPLLWTAASKLQPGDVSEPLFDGAMVELIRLVERTPARPRTFDEAKPLILAEIRAKYVSDERTLALGKFRDTFKTELNQAAVDTLIAEAPHAPLRPRR